MVQLERQIHRGIEKAIFQDRAKELSSLLAISQLSPLFQGLPKNPRLVDMYSGTGAGAQAVYGRLKELGNKPAKVTIVDDFLPFNRLEPDPLGFNAKKYSSGIEETQRNMEKLSEECMVDFCRDDALDYMRSITKEENGMRSQFDLITAFSVTDVLCSPLRGGGQRELPSILKIIAEHGNIPTILTFGSVYDIWMEGVSSHLKAQYAQQAWNLYAKPEGVGNPDWDKWILTNRQLEFKKFG